MKIDVAVLVATFNRPSVTKQSLQRLNRAARSANLTIGISVVDASTNNQTAVAIQEYFPEVAFERVPPDFFWAQSMRRAWERIQDWDYNALMWLNDDVFLFRDALAVLVQTSKDFLSKAIIVGSTRGEGIAQVTYGGNQFGPWFAPLHGTKLVPINVAQRIDYFEGNVVFVPRAVDQILGGFPSEYLHGMADTAYSLRAHRARVQAYLAPGFLGYCAANPQAQLWKDPRLPPITRWSHLVSPKGKPFRQWLRLCRELGGLTAPGYFIFTYAKLILAILFPFRQVREENRNFFRNGRSNFSSHGSHTAS